MTRSRGHQFLLTACFLAAIYAVGLVQAGIELAQGQRPQVLDFFSQRPSSGHLRSFENDLGTGSWFAQSLRPPMQYLRFMTFKDAGEKALVGRGGWWFYKTNVRYLTEPCTNRPEDHSGPGEVVSVVVSFRDQLASRGIHLLVIPVPGKPAVYPDMLTRRAVACDPRVREHTGKVLADLAAAGVETVNLFEVFAEARTTSRQSDTGAWYLACDTHWTNRGARLAAEAVTRRIQSLGWAPAGSVRYDIQPALVRRPGDILRMLKCPPIEALFEPEVVPCEQVVRQDNREPYRDDPGASILVLGDSFLRIYEYDEPGSAGFIAHLARELSQPLASIVSDGGASTLARQELARKPGLLAGKTLVVWEFVERDILFGMEGWQDVSLPKAASSKPEHSTSAPGVS